MRSLLLPRLLPVISSSHLCQSPSTLFLQSREFTSLVDRLSTAVTRRLTSLTETHMMPLGEERITELRRPYPRRRPMQQNLAERLKLQRQQRALLVPSQVIISKDKMYMELVWPATALAAVEKQQEQEQEEEEKEEKEKTISTSSGYNQVSSEMTSSGINQKKIRLGDHRTRLLAELLRVYSPSTDVIGSDALIYGRRGITIEDVIPVGNYALRIVFSDGHTGGIYPYEYLFDLGRHKYTRMREYIRQLKAKRKSRNPPKRAPSQRLTRRVQNNTIDGISQNSQCGKKKNDNNNNSASGNQHHHSSNGVSN
ncbi:Myb domain protein 40 [Trypanosoma theileri]|uniref:Myb domain protein 40 n=1 Tax=Trypanosoma theileri TaxID=67003 RepID=A0A1X0NI95_9TRYP|nr:Myb domain protein 40 [Trypanosoma theileri]ORC84193.1 Myb domain protein 40 [Trypanosoma theileri]